MASKQPPQPGEMPPAPIGLARLAKTAFRGGDLRPVARELVRNLEAHPDDAAALYDLGIIFQLFGQRDRGLAHQSRALSLERVYSHPATGRAKKPLTLLMFAIPGDLMANTPVEFILEDANILLHVVYVRPDGSLPDRLPRHDVALVGIGESPQARVSLYRLAVVLSGWPSPVLNNPLRIIDLARERLHRNLGGRPGVEIPTTMEISRDDLARLGRGDLVPGDILDDARSFPLIARPTGSHAGQGLEKLDDRQAVADYAERQSSQQFFVSRFVDYRSPDGLFRKYRIAMIEGRPFICHMAVSAHWMVHYLNAGMTEDPAKRAEEAAAMRSFDAGFARRHEAAFASLREAVGLDYFVIDCAESRDGGLLIFEADTAMVIHSMDPPDLFPYKAAQMDKAYAAFRAMLANAASRKA